jgi:hypothetical protein
MGIEAQEIPSKISAFISKIYYIVWQDWNSTLSLNKQWNSTAGVNNILIQTRHRAWQLHQHKAEQSHYSRTYIWLER